METGILLFECKDQQGIVAKITQFLFHHNCNIIDADQHSTNIENGHFFIRLEFCFNSKIVDFESIVNSFDKVAKEFSAKWHFHNKKQKLRMGIMVSQTDHCLVDLLYRVQSGEIKVEIPFILSNHNTYKQYVENMGIPFHYVPISSEDSMEKEMLKLIEKSDFLVLARYMQILSPSFLASYGKDIINIHHSFLPSFKGGNPYHQAWNRGVKLIGATAHFVTEDLDEGPIITQVVDNVSHRDDLNDLKRKGRNLEKIALSQAIFMCSEHRIMRHKNKTIVFD